MEPFPVRNTKSLRSELLLGDDEGSIKGIVILNLGKKFELLRYWQGLV